jgi:hypothetical protein
MTEEHFLDLLKEALANVNWKYVTLSRFNYEDGKPRLNQDYEWYERPFAYEIYHQLRCIWDKDKRFEADSLIQGEVFKDYQEIKNMNKMPDFIVHLPESNSNLAVMEVKLAVNKYQIPADLDKLTLFRTIKPLSYKLLVEIVIGSDDDLHAVDIYLNRLEERSRKIGQSEQIMILYLSLDTHETRPRLIAHSKGARARE